MKIGVLALQGDFSAHQKCLEHQNVPVLQVRESKDLDAIEGLVLPGGESSVMSRLLLRYGLFEPLQKKIQQGLPIFATCAGLILLSQKCHPAIPKLLAVLPIEVERNAYGAQIE
ncbi:MAG: pyridoxal 5'-phosphate synthase glutaminase subunit PdxT, partial [Planctomycetota bacterium]